MSSLAIPTIENDSPPKKRLFPLNLTPFEEYMVWDDRPSYPMTFVVQLTLDGNLDREAIQEALPLTLARHPLLQAVVGKGKGGRRGWAAASDPQIKIDWGDPETPVRPDQEAINIREQPGLRIWIRSDSQQAVVTAQFHHACCDGIGSYEFLGDWLWYYSQLTNGDEQEALPEIEPSRLRSRVTTSYRPENFRDDEGRFRKYETFRFSWMCVKNKVRLLPPKKNSSHTPENNAEASLPNTSNELFPGIRERVLTKDVFKKVRLTALDRGQSINEMLIERLLVTLRQWNDEQKKGSSGQYCIMMPMDLREPETKIGSAANLVTYSLIRRDATKCVMSQELADSIRNEMVQIKQSRHRTCFMNMMAGLRRSPHLALRFFTRHRVLATAILSNTGDPTKQFNAALPRVAGAVQVGNLQLAKISGVPPMRPGTRMSVSIFTYRRELRICMRCDPHLFKPSDTDHILERYVEQILLDPSSD